ncbi:MAG: hypothetical protein EOR16_23680 [Mesorhizobium sp.]|uniref:hypothetical protein n=1 Tax=Mesorhizobium sp. TaxID=1871066 RepID=UPI000FE93504|nr:hypothetical protein [Mesorhizobium sp.]RWI54776.1 MAG: hypothetical protein EOR16_23680 [Mesorhizobium sp.]
MSDTYFPSAAALSRREAMIALSCTAIAATLPNAAFAQAISATRIMQGNDHMSRWWQTLVGCRRS